MHMRRHALLEQFPPTSYDLYFISVVAFLMFSIISMNQHEFFFLFLFHCSTHVIMFSFLPSFCYRYSSANHLGPCLSMKSLIRQIASSKMNDEDKYMLHLGFYFNYNYLLGCMLLFPHLCDICCGITLELTFRFICYL